MTPHLIAAAARFDYHYAQQDMGELWSCQCAADAFRIRAADLAAYLVATRPGLRRMHLMME